MNAFTALADPTRLRIVEMLGAQQQLAASEIAREFRMTPSAISQHLKVLKEAKLVEAEVRKQQRIYRLNPAGVLEIQGWVMQMRAQWEARFEALDALLKQENMYY